MKLLKYSPLMFFVLLFACEQVVDIEIPEQDPQLVLSSFYESGDLRIKANLTKSLHILSPENTGDVWDATVNLYEDDVLIGQLEDQLDTLFANYAVGIDSLTGEYIYEEYILEVSRAYLLDLAVPLQTGKTYKITAEAPDFVPISATQELLPIPNVVSFDYKPRGGLDLEGGSVDLFKLGIQDVAGEDNYYEITLYTDDDYPGDTKMFWQKRYLEGSFTPGVEDGQGGNLLTRDDLFDGDLYNIDVTTWPIDTTYYNIKLDVKSISRDKYLFSKSINAYWNAEDNPFAEPVIVPTNVENGLGMFSMENITEFIIE